MPGFALLWEMRLGKSLVGADTATRLRNAGKIDAVIIIAPNGVHLNWARTVIPEAQELNDSIIEWSSNSAGRKDFQTRIQAALHHPGLVWLCVNYEAINTKNLSTYLEKFVALRKCLLIVDESHKVKNPKAISTRAIIQLAKRCPYRRILTGTPVTQGPFDLYSQFHIIDPLIFHEVVQGKKKSITFTAFRTRYGEWEQIRYGSGPLHQELVRYRDLDHLYETIKPYSSRLTLPEVFDDLPELIYEKRMFEMSPDQQKIYDDLRDNLIATLDSGAEITAQQAMVNLLRLQQISRGFVGGVSDGDEAQFHVADLGDPKPSLRALVDFMEQTEGKVIIWCKFTPDVDTLFRELNHLGIGAFTRFDGQCSVEEREQSLYRLNNDPDVKGMICGLATGTEGRDMAAADTTIFYSHTYKLTERKQAISRFQGINQKAEKILVVDFICANSVDERCLSALDKKENLAQTLTGDRLRKILRGEK